MSRKLFTRALIAAGMVVAFVIISAVPALTEPKKRPKGFNDSTPCTKAYWTCVDACRQNNFGGPKIKACTLKCDNALLACSEKEKPKAERTTTPANESPNSPGKNTGVLNPVNVGGVKQPGNSGMNSQPKGKKVQESVNVFGNQQLETGASSQPKGKVKVDTGVSGVKQINEGWSSQSTSGGTIMMQQSGRGKKKN
jgi:hypothetical protein